MQRYRYQISAGATGGNNDVNDVKCDGCEAWKICIHEESEVRLIKIIVGLIILGVGLEV